MIRATSILFALGMLSASSALQAAPKSFSGRLAAAPCRNAGDIEITDGEVQAGESVTCAASFGGEIRVVDTTVALGGSLHLRSGGATAAPWGAVDCDPTTDANCNYCANDVLAQFDALFNDFEETLHSFSFDENNYYTPAGKQPNDLFVGSSLWTHVQGFVRTNSPDRPIAVTHSWTKFESQTGAVLIVQETGGSLELDLLHETWGNHPTGAAVLGSRVWFGDKLDPDEPYRLRSVIVDSWFGTPQEFLSLPDHFQGGGPTMGGGVGLAKLASGGYLVVAVGPGGDEDDVHSDFFFMIGNDKGDGTRAELGEAVAVAGPYDMEIFGLSRWWNDDSENALPASSSAFEHSENISLITECGTGDLYVINTTGDDQFYGDGYYRISRIDWGPLAAGNEVEGAALGTTGPKLYPIAVGIQNQNEHECWQRGGATAYANSNHELELYCAERKATPGESNMHFVRRRPKQ